MGNPMVIMGGIVAMLALIVGVPFALQTGELVNENILVLRSGANTLTGDWAVGGQDITGVAAFSTTGAVTHTGAVTASGGGSHTGTWTDMGSVTTVDINGGTLDGSIIGGAVPAAGTFTTVDLNGGTIDGATIGGATPGAITATTLDATGGGALTGTWTDLGSVTTVDLNGGTIDGATIGGSSAAAGTFTTVNTSGNVVMSGTGDKLLELRSTNNESRLYQYGPTGVSGIRHRFIEGVGDGTAGNQRYGFLYSGAQDEFTFSTEDADGAANPGVVWTVEDGTDDIAFDGNVGIADLVPTTALSFGVASTISTDAGDLTINPAGDVNLQAGGTTLVEINGTTGAVGIGAGADTSVTDSLHEIINTYTVPASANARGLWVKGTITHDTGHGGGAIHHVQVDPNGSVLVSTSGASIITTMDIDEPVITLNSAAVTTAATVRIVKAPTEASNNYALFVDDGLVQVDDAIVVGSPTGGDKGGGSINATAVYDDNALLTDYVSDAYLGELDRERLDFYDSISPDGSHEPANEFAERGDWVFDPIEYGDYFLFHGNLPNLPTEDEYVDDDVLSNGAYIQALMEVVEVLVLQNRDMAERIDELESAIAERN